MFGRRRHRLDPKAQALVQRVAAGDDASWGVFVQTIAPFIEQVTQSSRHMGPLRSSMDDRRNVLTETLAKLRSGDFRALRTFADWARENPGKDFEDWLAIVVTNQIRSYVRTKLGGDRDRDRGDDGEPHNKRLLHTLATLLPDDHRELAHRPAITDANLARQLVEHAERNLPADQLAALRLWLMGAGFAEIAADCHLADAATAERLVRAALARLRRHLATL